MGSWIPGKLSAVAATVSRLQPSRTVLGPAFAFNLSLCDSPYKPIPHPALSPPGTCGTVQIPVRRNKAGTPLNFDSRPCVGVS